MARGGEAKLKTTHKMLEYQNKTGILPALRHMNLTELKETRVNTTGDTEEKMQKQEQDMKGK